MQHQVIHIHPEAPPKPAFGAPCNGCGVCCLAEPCPVGMLISRRRKGACDILVWLADGGVYRCGLLLDSGGVGPAPLRRWPALRRLWRRVWLRWARRVIAAGRGCDADFTVDRP